MELKLLVLRLKDGDYEAFDKIYSLFKLKTFHFANKILNSKENSLNVVQDVFLKVWEKRETIDESKPFKAWLFTIVYHSTIDHLRKYAHESRIPDLNLLASVAESQDMDKQMSDTDLIEQVLKLIETFPPRQREIFKMSRFDGLSHREIAEKLGISEKTVENLVGRATAHLKKAMSGTGFSLLLVSLFLEFIS